LKINRVEGGQIVLEQIINKRRKQKHIGNKFKNIPLANLKTKKLYFSSSVDHFYTIFGFSREKLTIELKKLFNLIDKKINEINK